MAGKDFFTDNESLKSDFSAARAIITAPFFGNNVKEVRDVASAYELARTSSGIVELEGEPIPNFKKLGLKKNTKRLLFNDGAVVGRCAAARRIVGEDDCNLTELLPSSSSCPGRRRSCGCARPRRGRGPARRCASSRGRSRRCSSPTSRRG